MREHIIVPFLALWEAKFNLPRQPLGIKVDAYFGAEVADAEVDKVI